MSKHKWELVKTTWEYPSQQSTGTLPASEYAYLLCQECEQVVKRRIETTLPARHIEQPDDSLTELSPEEERQFYNSIRASKEKGSSDE